MSEELLVRHCSPTLAGMKTGNLFACSFSDEYELKECVRCWNRTLTKKGLRVLPLRFQNGRALIYVYRPARLSVDLRHDTAERLLHERGYCTETSERCVVHLIERLCEYEEFPHEIGLFLGYPPEDVHGFIENKADGCKCVGCWKVYGDAEAAQKTFAKYTVKISLLAKDGYKFGKTVTAKINGKTASVETFDDGSINVSLKLTASSKDHTHTAGSTWQFDDMEHWKICSYKDCGTLVGKKQMHSNSDPDGKCDICGYQLPIEVPEGTTASGTNTVSSKNPSDETSDPNESTIGSSDVTSKQDKDKNNENKQDNEKNGPRIWMLLLILPAAALVLAVGGIVLVILLKKKK